MNYLNKKIIIKVERYKKKFLYFLYLIDELQYFKIKQSASILTFTTLFALIPILTLLLIIFNIHPITQDAFYKFEQILINIINPFGNTLQMKLYIDNFIHNTNKLSIPSIPIIILSAIILLNTIEAKFNEIWNVSTKRNILFKLLIYIFILIILPLLFTGFFYVWKIHIKPLIMIFDITNPRSIGFLFSILGTSIIFTILYSILPYRYVPIKNAIIGSIITAIIFEACKRTFVNFYFFYFFKNYQFIYGAFAFVPLFVLWIFLLWYIILFGGIITYWLTSWGNIIPQKGTKQKGDFENIIEILTICYNYKQKDEKINIKKINKEVDLKYDKIESILEQLTINGYLKKKFYNQWVLIKNPKSIMLDDLFIKCIYTPNFEKTNQINGNILNNLKGFLEKLHISLEDFNNELKSNDNNA